MTLFRRIRDLITADAHGVVDALEDEALALRQCLRDAEAELDRKRARLAALTAEQARLATEGEGLAERIAALDADVELALAEDREELARFTVRRLLPIRRAVGAVAARQAEAEAERRQLEETTAEQAEALAELRVRIAERLTRLERDPAGRRGSGAEGDGRAVREEEIELELLRRRRAPGGGHGMADGMSHGIPHGMADGMADGMGDGIAAPAKGGA